MADEDPSASNPAANPSQPKKETVRITLPPKPEDTPMVKRETVRINAPGAAPKKETTTIIGQTPLPSAAAPIAPPPPATRPLVPPPAPRAPGAPPSGAKPAIPPMAPKPAAAAMYAEVKPVTIKAAPKKETARISVAPTQKLPPQATVRLSQPSQLLAAAPAPSIRPAAAPAAEVVAGTDKIAMAMSWVAVALALAAAALSYMAYSA